MYQWQLQAANNWLLLVDVAAPPAAIASILGAATGALMAVKGWIDAHHPSVTMPFAEYGALQQSSETWTFAGIVTTSASVALGVAACACLLLRSRRL